MQPESKSNLTQTNRQIDGQTDGEMDTQKTGKKTDRETDRKAHERPKPGAWTDGKRNRRSAKTSDVQKGSHLQ